MTILEDLENLFYGRTPPTDVEIQSALRDWKNSVRVATTAALTLATDLEAGDTLDGITLAEGDRVLVKDQASGIENGIYNVSASGAPSRASDMEATTDAAGVIVLVLEGSTQADTMWLCSDDSFTEVGVDAITFIPFLPSGAGIDTDAIHQSVANEINSLTLKATPVAADRIVIEDSEASWAKKTTPLSALPALGTTPTHASNHVTGGSDEIDGDKVDIDWDPSNYTPTTSPSEADSVDNLTAHLAGIDAKLAGGAGSFVAQDGSGNASVSGTLNSAGDFTVATNKLTVDATTGNTSVAGTLGSTGDLAVNTDKLVVAASDGSLSLNGGGVTINGTTGNYVSPNLTYDGILNAATGAEVSYSLTPTINKATSGDYIAFEVDVTETSAPGTANKLASFGIGGTPVFTLSSGGILATTAAGSTSTPSVAVRDASLGMYSPASNQVGLVANGEAIIVDNDAATPSLRGDVTSTWDLGETSFRWNKGWFAALDLYGNSGITIENVSGDVALFSANGVLMGPSAFSDYYLGIQPQTVAGTSAVPLYIIGGSTANNGAGDSGDGSAVIARGGVAGTATGTQGAGGDFEIDGGGLSGVFTHNASAGVVRIGTKDGSINSAYSTSAIQTGHSGLTWTHTGAFVVTGVRALGTSTFSIDGDDAGRLCNWTGTTTGVAGTVDQGVAGQVTTIILSGTAGTITFAPGSGVTLEALRGKTLTTNAPGASDVVVVSICYVSPTFAIVTGDLA